VLGSYVTIFKTPGALRFSFAGFIGRMPISMEGLSLIFFIVAKTHKYSIAGAMTAMASIVVAIASPIWSRLADQFGQRKILLLVAPVRIILVIVLILAVDHNAPKWSWFLLVMIAEIPAINVGGLVRRRWIHVLERRGDDHSKDPDAARDLINTAYSYEALMDEIVFIFGPLIATACATLISPPAGLIAAMIFLGIGLPILALQTSSEPPAVPKNKVDPHPAVIRNRTIQAIILPATFIGGFFGAVSLTVVGFAEYHNAAKRTGLLLAIWALGSATSAVINGAIKWRTTYAKRFLIALVVLLLFSTPFIFARNIPMMAAALFINGLAISPLIVTAYGVAETAVPASQITEALAWVIAGMPLGGALASAITGVVIDHYGATTGLLIPTLFLCGSLLTVLPYRNSWRLLLNNH